MHHTNSSGDVLALEAHWLKPVGLRSPYCEAVITTQGGKHMPGLSNRKECERHGCVFKHPSRRLLCRCILRHSDVGDSGNTLYLLYGIHPLTIKREVDYARFLGFDGSLH